MRANWKLDNIHKKVVFGFLNLVFWTAYTFLGLALSE